MSRACSKPFSPSSTPSQQHRYLLLAECFASPHSPQPCIPLSGPGVCESLTLECGQDAWEALMSHLESVVLHVVSQSGSHKVAAAAMGAVRDLVGAHVDQVRAPSGSLPTRHAIRNSVLTCWVVVFPASTAMLASRLGCDGSDSDLWIPLVDRVRN